MSGGRQQGRSPLLRGDRPRDRLDSARIVRRACSERERDHVTHTSHTHCSRTPRSALLSWRKGGRLCDVLKGGGGDPSACAPAQLRPMTVPSSTSGNEMNVHRKKTTRMVPARGGQPRKDPSALSRPALPLPPLDTAQPRAAREHGSPRARRQPGMGSPASGAGKRGKRTLGT